MATEAERAAEVARWHAATGAPDAAALAWARDAVAEAHADQAEASKAS